MYKGTTRVLIGDGTTTGTSLPGIKKGDLLFLKENGTVITTNAAAAALPKFEKITIACGIADGVAILSSPIQGNTVSKYEGKNYSAPTEQVAYLGFNGTAGTGIATDVNTEYRLRVLLLDTYRFNGQRQTISDVNYTASATDTEYDVITKLVNLYVSKDYGHNYFEGKVKIEKVSDGTFAASEQTLTVVKGSTKAVFGSSDPEHDTNVDFAVGDLIRIGGTGATVPVYKIVAKDGANITLDTPYQGISETVAAASVGYLATPTEYGIKLTGIAQNSKIGAGTNSPLDTYEWVKFKAAFTEANDLASSQYAARYTEATTAKPGNGYWKQVADAEEAAKGYWGDTSKRRYFDQRIASNVVVDETYGVVVITSSAVQGGDFQDKYEAPVRTEIYIPNGTNQATASGDNFLHILNGFFSTALGFTAIATMS